MDHRVRSFDFAPSMTTSNSGSSSSRRGNRERGGGKNDVDFDSTRVLVSLHNNSMEVWGLDGCCRSAAGGDGGKASKKAERDGGAAAADDEAAAAAAATASRMMVLDLQGHRSDVRAVAVSSDGAMVASVSHGLAKVWSSKTRQCVRSAPCGFGLTVAFAPGDRHLLVGTKEGNLQVIDLGSGEMIQDYAAHDKAVWSIDLRPDGKGLVSGSADRQVGWMDGSMDRSIPLGGGWCRRRRRAKAGRGTDQSRTELFRFASRSASVTGRGRGAGVSRCVAVEGGRGGTFFNVLAGQLGKLETRGYHRVEEDVPCGAWDCPGEKDIGACD